MTRHQQGILLPPPEAARFISFGLVPDANHRTALESLLPHIDGERTVLGLGLSLVARLGGSVPGLRGFPHFSATGLDIPSTPAALWVWARGEDRGELFHRSRRMVRAVASGFRPLGVVEGMKFDIGRDLSGYEDGTENPKNDAAVTAAFVAGQGDGLDGSSFVAVQQWVHDFAKLEAMSAEAQNHAVGRDKVSNDELEDAPPSAHVKRTAQESFEPAAFVVRRSMPWAAGGRAGLVFVAFGHSLDAFEAQLRRMVGEEDGIQDGIFQFTRPISGAYFWCPPMRNDRVNLDAILGSK